MLKTETWWESLFSGDLSIGISVERQQEIDNEDFLYLKNLGDVDFHEESPS
ncbi:hypothetical protein ACIQ4I_07220 [Rummeliibacillus sp. NPDC094406]|uniref:hypothetical protein n=1 Tax=Rummeliibacillus sp. NPDC094406 TaxID=3364511 RepID=UPI003818DA04